MNMTLRLRGGTREEVSCQGHVGPGPSPGGPGTGGPGSSPGHVDSGPVGPCPAGPDSVVPCPELLLASAQGGRLDVCVAGTTGRSFEAGTSGRSFEDVWSAPGISEAGGPAASKVLRQLRWASLGLQFDWTLRKYATEGPYRWVHGGAIPVGVRRGHTGGCTAHGCLSGGWLAGWLIRKVHLLT